MDVSAASSSLDFDHRTVTNYIVSAQKPTVVTGCVVGNFRNSHEYDLIVARTNRIELLLVVGDGLKPYKEIPIYGRIGVIRSFRAPNEAKDSLLILTCKFQIIVLGFDDNGDVKTRASGNIADRVGRHAETGILCSVHKSGLIAVRIYEGLLKIVQWSDDRELTCFNLRFGDSQIVDFAFLDSKSDVPGRPSIAYIYQNASGRHLKCSYIDTKEKEFIQIWNQDNVESEASLLIPLPTFGGLVVVGQESISYHRDGTDYTAVSPSSLHSSQICCFAFVDPDGQRILLGDISGRLFMLVLQTVEDDLAHKSFESNVDKKTRRKSPVDIHMNDENSCQRRVTDIKIQLLGEISIPECLVYLDNRVIFVGSRFGDSQLVKILPSPSESSGGTYVEVINSFPNLGPIRDMIVLNSDGQNQLVTCSGAFKEGSLRIVRSGIGIEERATIDLENVMGLFAFNLKYSDPQIHDFMVISYHGASHLLQITGEEMEDVSMNGFDFNKGSLYAGSLPSRKVIQVTDSAVLLICPEKGLLAQFETKISLCSVNPQWGQILLASANSLIYLEVNGDTIIPISTLECMNEVSCLDLMPLGMGALTIFPFSENEKSKFCAVGFWNENSVGLFTVGDAIYRFPDSTLTMDIIPRGVLLAQFDAVVYLLVALGDGTLLYYQVDPTNGALSEQKKATLGTQPTKLQRFCTDKQMHVFACSDRPVVIYSSNQKLVFSNVNLKVVTQMCPLNASAYPDSLALSDGKRLIIGVVDNIQKLHIRSVPLGESVTRIAHQPETGTIAIITCREAHTLPNNEKHLRNSVSVITTSKSQLQPMSAAAAGQSNADSEHQITNVHSICILDVSTFEVLHVCELPANEYAISICAAKLGDTEQPYYVVGTALYNESETECKLGRILVLSYEGNKIRSVAEKEVKGSCYAVASIHNKLVCGINSTVRLFTLSPKFDLRLEHSTFNFIHAILVKTKGDLILVGDLMRSVTMLAYKPAESQLEEVARDYQSDWVTSAEIIDADTVIAGENGYNLYVCRKDVEGESEDDRIRFQQMGFWHLGENLNVLRRGHLLTPNNDPTTPYSNPILYGTADGGLGLIVQLPLPVFKYTHSLQTAIAKNINNCSRIGYDDYRNFTSEQRIEKHRGFVDGDLIETLSELTREKVEKIIKGLQQPPGSALKGEATYQEVIRFVEDISRLH